MKTIIYYYFNQAGHHITLFHWLYYSYKGLIEIVQALTLVKCPVRLKLAGSFSNKSFKDQVTALPGWSLVDFIGFVPRNQAHKVFKLLLPA